MSEQARISHLVRRAIKVLENDCQGARRCLNDVLALLAPELEEEVSAEDPVARGVFESGGLARWQARRALTYIETHLESRLDVPLLAKLVSFSKSHFLTGIQAQFRASSDDVRKDATGRESQDVDYFHESAVDGDCAHLRVCRSVASQPIVPQGAWSESRPMAPDQRDDDLQDPRRERWKRAAACEWQRRCAQ